MIACNWTACAGTGTWDGNGPWETTGTASAQSWPTYAYDMWRQAERVAESIRKYEESRNWAKAPAVIKARCPRIYNHILLSQRISPRPWSGRNFHK